jgi:sugar/nucleoside kinase (ribokinase family)
VQTGGGDNLNAGYCLGLLLGLDPSQCMILGMASSGSYVQESQSPDVTQLISYLKNWIEELNMKYHYSRAE